MEVGGGFGVLGLLLRIIFTMRGWTICVHANGYRIPLLMLVASMLNAANRYYCVMHGVVNVEKKYHSVSPRDVKLEPYIFKNFQNVICVSEFERKTLFKMYGKRDDVLVIHNGVDVLEQLPVRNGEDDGSKLIEPVFITTGGFEQCKAADLALEMLAPLSRLGFRPSLIVCGRDSAETGSNRVLCEQMARESGVELVYEGEIKDKTLLQDLYSRAHFYMGLSRFDTFNVSVLEGAATGCVPVVSTACGASELFDEKSAVVVDINDERSLEAAASRIAELANNKVEYGRLSQGAQAVARSNTWDDVARQYWEILSHG